ncbi:Kelch repeat-containing protein [Marinicella litoralis]|uniref:Kelch motif protein n=1 Tax=Marinicella litoralis TaxID=644220 RepID=A0A4R6XJC5_9GAMM|nr:galactose oxidase [Marinicella litoralis]TDR18449.1 Kelch motif protein [Marinicella litoralis]
MTKKTGILCLLIFVTVLLINCSNQLSVQNKSYEFPVRLPHAVSNNAVAYLQLDGQDQFYTFNGLHRGKSYTDISNHAFVWKKGQWQTMMVPEQQLPVLASTAVAVNGSVYLFGGYTVAADHSEKSIPNVWRIDGINDQWYAMPVMPVPVDDAVAVVYQNRYIYLISGWHDVDNVDLVQVFDTKALTWQQATPFPLPAVFGHAGGIVGRKILICDGVKVLKTSNKKQFLPSPACAMGTIDDQDPTVIDWEQIPHHSGTAYYRMAAGSHASTEIHFVGGSDNPYNYDGIGYNEVPSKPSNGWRVYDVITKTWKVNNHDQSASMDHRALLNSPHGFVILGGMIENQLVTDQIIYHKKQKLN